MRYKIFCILLVLCFSVTALPAQRDTIPVNDNWKFVIDSDEEGFKAHWFTQPLENSLQVTLPHTWNVVEATQNHYGWAWYQRKVTIPASWKNKYIELEFGAVNHTCIIYVNGEKISEHTGDGFNAFKVPLHEHVQFNGENTITIAVNNAYSYNKIPFGSSFDWPNDGGIIRPVYLIVSGNPHVNFLHATPQLNTKDSSATLNIKLNFNQKENIRLHIKITEENQTTKNVVYDETVSPTWNNENASVNLSLKNVNPWHFDFPNLYHVEVTVLSGNKVSDKVSTNIGFRSVEFQDGKFLLNGEAIKLMGVEWTAGSHPDFGFAEPDSLIRAMGRLMKNVNCIFSRQHFQQGNVFYDFCDRNGILVQQELPLWGPETPANDTMYQIAISQLKSMIQNLYNHPSIFSWGVGNELRGQDPEMKKMILSLLQKTRELDPSRNTAYVSNTLNWSFYNSPQFTPDAGSYGDYLMMNEYAGTWWQLPSAALGLYLDSIHDTYPQMPFFIAEFGICEPNFFGGDERRIQDLIYHMAVYESKPYIQGAIYFDLTDYRTHYPGTKEQNKYRRRIHGVYDMYGNPKPSMTALREYASPVEIQNITQTGEAQFSILLFCSLGLPQHITRGYRLYISEDPLHWESGEMHSLPVLHPGEKYSLLVEDRYGGHGVITIVRPTGYIVSQKMFGKN